MFVASSFHEIIRGVTIDSFATPLDHQWGAILLLAFAEVHGIAGHNRVNLAFAEVHGIAGHNRVNGYFSRYLHCK